MDKLLTIIIPVRWEAENIQETVQSLKQRVRTPHSVLIVDDHVAAKDPTVSAVQRLAKRYKNIRFVTKKSRDAHGFGPALCRSMYHVKTPYTVFVMGDGCDDAKAIDRMVAKAYRTGCDVVCGSRYMKGGKKIGGQNLQNVASTLLNRILFILGMPTRDATNAFKLYKTSFLRLILPAKPLPGVEFTLQLSIEGYKRAGTYVDIHTHWSGRTKGKSKVRLIRSSLQYLALATQFFVY